MPEAAPIDSPPVQARLDAEYVAWMTTVRENGTPQTSPIWFLWDGATFLVYSLESARVSNITGQQRVSLNLRCNDMGGDVVIVEGTAEVHRDLPSVAENEPYLAKYGEIMAERDWSPEWFAGRYSAPIVITPTKWRHW